MTEDPQPTPRPRVSRRTGEELPPAELRALARARSEARRAHQWTEADRLRAEIEAQGWKIVDRGTEGRLVRAHPPDVVEDDGGVRYGWTGAVPAWHGDRDPAVTTIVARATRDPASTQRISALVDRQAGLQLVLVADPGAPLAAMPVGAEVVRIAGAATPGVVVDIAIACARGAVVVVGEGWAADTQLGDLRALVGLLEDPTVGVAGWGGRVSEDLRRFEPVRNGGADPAVVAWAGMAFRVTDGIERGPADQAFTDGDVFAAWWSLVLRDDGPDRPARSARALDMVGMPEGTTANGVGPSTEPAPRSTRRDRYRLMDRFAHRADLLTTPAAAAPPRAPRG